MSTDNGSSASQDSQDSVNENQNGNQQTIKQEDHLRAIEDLKKFKARSRELETQLQQIQLEMEEQKNKKLTEANDYKSLYEQSSQKVKEWEAKHSRLKESMAYNEKYKEAQKALLDAGLRKDALKILDNENLDSIIIEYTSEGRTIPNGVSEFVDSFKKNYSFAFEQKSPARVNGSGGNASSQFDSSMTPAKLFEIEKKHGVRSDQYRAAIEQYRKQNTN